MLSPNQYEISTEPGKLDMEFIHEFLRLSYWAKNIPRGLAERAIQNSLCFGAYCGDRQIGFARTISDFATFAYVLDVFVAAEHRGRGVSKLLVRALLAHPKLQGLRQIFLITRDAHGLYAQFGFQPLEHPERFMEIQIPNIYG